MVQVIKRFILSTPDLKYKAKAGDPSTSVIRQLGLKARTEF